MDKSFQIFEDIPFTTMSFVSGREGQSNPNSGSSELKKTNWKRIEIPDYYICQYPVTQLLYKTIMNENLQFADASRLPMVMVSWPDIQAFLERINKRLNLTDQKKYRLPFEIEWIYAALGGRYSKNYKYAGGHCIEKVAWTWTNSHREIQPIGLKSPNELGLYDMSGNLLEWCQSKSNGNTENILRGGSWKASDLNCEIWNQSKHSSSIRLGSIGFRLARTTL